jgi:hypothetical protein
MLLLKNAECCWLYCKFLQLTIGSWISLKVVQTYVSDRYVGLEVSPKTSSRQFLNVYLSRKEDPWLPHRSDGFTG